MIKIIFILVAVGLAIITFIYFLKEKPTCPKCGSKNLERTGNKRYKESPALAIAGSPESYHEIELKCLDCKHNFWDRKRAFRVS